MHSTELRADILQHLQREIDDIKCRVRPRYRIDVHIRQVAQRRVGGDAEIADPVASSANFSFDWKVTRPWTVADVVPAVASVTAVVPPAASVPVPPNW